MTEPWQIHVCPVHGPRTPTMLGDCPVGCCAEVMEVVRVVRDTRGAVGRIAALERELGYAIDALEGKPWTGWNTDTARDVLGGQSTAEEAFEQSSGGETLEEAQARQLRGEHAFGPQPDTRGGDQP